jgi:import receptor subunit TOM20
MKNSDIALISAGVAITATVGYMIYWDSKRRSDPEFRKQLSKLQ